MSSIRRGTDINLQMSNSDWRDSEQEPHKPRPVIQGRTEFEDSLLAARREDQAQERRRSAALSQALKARSIDSDPEGKKFLADRQKAMAARRLENARLDQKKPVEDFSVSLLDVWEEASNQRSDERPQGRRWSAGKWMAIGAALALCAAILAVWAWGGFHAA